MVDICQQLGHPTVQRIVDGLMNLYSCVAGGMLLDGLLGYLTFETTALGKWYIEELFILTHSIVIFCTILKTNGLD